MRTTLHKSDWVVLKRLTKRRRDHARMDEPHAHASASDSDTSGINKGINERDRPGLSTRAGVDAHLRLSENTNADA